MKTWSNHQPRCCSSWCDADGLVVRAHSLARDQVVAELAQAPNAHMDQGLLAQAFLHVEVELDHLSNQGLMVNGYYNGNEH